MITKWLTEGPDPEPETNSYPSTGRGGLSPVYRRTLSTSTSVAYLSAVACFTILDTYHLKANND